MCVCACTYVCVQVTDYKLFNYAAWTAEMTVLNERWEHTHECSVNQYHSPTCLVVDNATMGSLSKYKPGEKQNTKH